MLKIKIIIIALFFTTIANAQNLKFGERIIAGSSLTYMLHRNEDLPKTNFHEFTWNNNIAVNLNQSLYFGLGYLYLYTKGSVVFPYSDHKETYNITTAFLQYDFLPKQKNRAFAEVSFGYGNYCFCKSEDPFKVEGLYYLGLGGGYEWAFSKRFSLDVAFMAYDVLNYKDAYQFNYTQYVVGLNFDFVNK